MQKPAPYDAAVERHYAAVAAQDGDRPTSTMADELIRRLETDLIVEFVRDVLGDYGAAPLLCDVGCGNGYTLRTLAQQFPRLRVLGIEKSAPLRELAEAATANIPNATIRSGDIRAAGFCENADILVCQRVLINLLEPSDQQRALDHLIAAVKPGGALLFIEACTAGMERLNAARAEFDLPPIAQADHNLYLPDGFFEHQLLEPYRSATWPFAPNHLSTHYYVTRVLHAALTGSKPFKRNSEFVRFLSSALPPAVGNYSPLEVRAFCRS